ncbi:hypothetical protein TRFO_19631 [Tritrichomonas foetus]|uniref:C2 NT-type domain-containing protein n=1 Tax=Tritrichomonas foetus TaxID=1144522 RepID=A0A1J4KHR7_9EUKA|nr:hypothetical protein TRFO_19631 [Tritrichomonas foetus]|eukprot:OHT10935.1 hypothetical protein TRFO_19631 [Tritrichomonas foetus]
MTKVKRKISLKNIVLIDVPTRQNRIFAKVKKCVKNVTTKPYPIINNQCKFAENVDIEVNLPKDLSKARHSHLIRISFRFENASGSGFSRYGIAKIDIVKTIISRELDIRMNLENCPEKPVLTLTLGIPAGISPFMSMTVAHSASLSFNQSNSIMSASMTNDLTDNSGSFVSTNGATSRSMTTSQGSGSGGNTSISSNASISNKSPNNSFNNENLQSIIKNSPSFPVANSGNNVTIITPQNNSPSSPSRISSMMAVGRRMSSSKSSGALSNQAMFGPTATGNGASSGNNSMNVSVSNSNGRGLSRVDPLDWLPCRIPQERYDELEKQIDRLLAGIINDEPAQ